MKKLINYDKKLTLYETELDNGLKVYLAPDARRASFSMNFFVNFGSAIDKYKQGNKEYDVPQGIAHFIEHQLFNQPDGTNISKDIMVLGGSANASTSTNYTSYYINGVKNFDKLLKCLIDYVTTPYFEKKSVEIEKGIIIQELELYNDDAYWKGFDGALLNAVHSHPVRNDIGGTKESVSNTTVEDLYRVYKAFYKPENMKIVITGNFDKSKALTIIENYFKKDKFESSEQVKLIYDKEPRSVLKRNGSKKMDVATTKGFTLFKIPKQGNVLDLRTSLSVLFSAELLDTSLFQEKYENILYEFGCFGYEIDDYILQMFYYESDDVKLIKEEIIKRVKNTPDKETFDYIMRAKEAYRVRFIDDVDGLANSIKISLLLNDEVIDYKKYYEEFTYEKFVETLKMINFDEYSYFEIRPKDVK